MDTALGGERRRGPRPPKNRVSGREIRRGAVLAALIVSQGACEWLAGVSEPEEVRVRIGSEDADTVTLITSMRFILVQNPDCPDDPNCPQSVHLQEADTTNVAVPFDRTYAFTDRLQIFLETFPRDSVAATLSMRVTIDGRDWYDDFRELQVDDGEGERETLRFLYEFHERTIN